jgi:hypothetical protein
LISQIVDKPYERPPPSANDGPSLDLVGLATARA